MTTVAIIGAGSMGTAIGRRLIAGGARVITSLAGRSRNSVARAQEAGMVDVGDAGIGAADIILSVVPPNQALAAAERMAAPLRDAVRRPPYVDCNAVGAATVKEIEAVISAAGAPFIDGCIIGLPPRAGHPGPKIFVSGPEASRCAVLDAKGLRISVMSGPVGAASALKMSYGGITKGLIGLAAIMALAAAKNGIADDFRRELQSSQPALFESFSRSVPDMIPKAARWVPEMAEAASFVGPDRPEHLVYQGLNGLYQFIAEDEETAEFLGKFFSGGGTAG